MKLYHLLFLIYSVLGYKETLIAPAPVPITQSFAPPVSPPPVTHAVAPQPPPVTHFVAPQPPPPYPCKTPQPPPPPPYPYNPRSSIYKLAEDNAMFPREALFY